MEVVFLGGVSSVGASCLAVQLAGQWFVVDAGVRVDRKADPLPDLSLLQDKDVRAVFVTHAHTDHIGALPLLHQAFPTVPIFASRATALLMEVMLADALKVMSRRAVEEMELPLYPESLVAGMLNQMRPLPVGEPVTLPELPGITISASRAGHIAGAVSLGFVGRDGSLVVSGDISMTPQRTVAGAMPPPVAHPDLLILESTYGARLHPNRQMEEQRLAQAVAGGLAEGGHVLIPCFGLGRGQELLLILQAAQEQGQIPDFPIYVDGLVRRVCDTYLLLPEALSPRLERQIRKGYQPFRGSNVTFVRDERDRERILVGPPACILSSSGMLTGGPSAWYATRLLADARASILITGYQDEESPGRRLLELAEHKQNTLEIGGVTLEVNCRVAKYSLSAHADGGELAAYAAAISPRRVALVHGDDDARTALRNLLTQTEVVLPTEGTSLEQRAGRRGARQATAEPASPLISLPKGIGKGNSFDYEHIETLWQAVISVPSLRIVTARELAVIWYVQATEEATQDILEVLAEDYEQRYFVRQHALEEAFRVRGAAEESPGDVLSDLVGSVLLLLVSLESAKPVICRAIEPGAAVRVQLPKGVSQERTRFPFSSILEVLGPAPQDVLQAPQKAPAYLNELVKAARRIRRSLSAYELAKQCSEEARYTLSELCLMAGLSGQSLEERLALAKLLHKHFRLFTQYRSVFDGEGLTLYGLSPEWREALEEPEEFERPDQNWILSAIEQYLGTPPDLYRRSVDPDTGAVTLFFHFPDAARERYREAIAAASEEAGVPISISPQAHQGELARAALRSLPAGLTSEGTPSIYLDRQVVGLHVAGEASTEEIAGAQSAFYEETGWFLELEGDNVSAAVPSHAGLGRYAGTASAEQYPTFQEVEEVRKTRMNQHDALQYAQHRLSVLPGYAKVGADVASFTLMPRFHFPLVARERYAAEFAHLEARTGWHVRLQEATNQGALIEMAHRLLPEGLSSIGTPSLYLDRQAVGVQCTGSASPEAIVEAEQRFLEETGWRLELALPGQGQGRKAESTPRMRQDEALAGAREMFNGNPDFYRAGADASRSILWIHFHFPDAVKQRYAEQLDQLSRETGWRVYVYPHVREPTLLEAAQRLLPSDASITGTPALHENQRLMHLACTGSMSAEALEEIQKKFAEETGWQLELNVTSRNGPSG